MSVVSIEEIHGRIQSIKNKNYTDFQVLFNLKHLPKRWYSDTVVVFGSFVTLNCVCLMLGVRDGVFWT